MVLRRWASEPWSVLSLPPPRLGPWGLGPPLPSRPPSVAVERFLITLRPDGYVPPAAGGPYSPFSPDAESSHSGRVELVIRRELQEKSDYSKEHRQQEVLVLIRQTKQEGRVVS